MTILRSLVSALVMVFALNFVLAQEDEPKSYHFDGNASITNNGFSFIPLFSLGKPATIVEMNIGGDRFTYEPQFRFDLEGMRPWSIIGFWRYKIINRERFMFRVGTQFPALAFMYEEVQSGNITYDKILAQRFLPFDFTLNYDLTPKLSIGLFYLNGNGLEKAEQLTQTNFLSLNVGLHDINITEKLLFNWNAQGFFLDIDGLGGYYTAHTFSIEHSDFPISIASTINKEIESTLDTENLTWNVSLLYSWATDFIKKE